jgi:hypothetical protein
MAEIRYDKYFDVFRERCYVVGVGQAAGEVQVPRASRTPH